MDSSSPSATRALRGVSSAELFARQAARESNARTYPRALPLAIGHARGCEVWSVEGRRYLDFFSGAGVLAVGHNHPKVVEAVRRQLDVLVHALDLPTPARDRFVTDVLSLLPENMRDRMRVHVCAPTGSDAIEAALKLCKRATGRSGVLAFQGAYHGMTAGALAATSCSELRARIPSLMPGVTFAPYSYCRRCPLKLDVQRCDSACGAFFETLLDDTHSGLPLPAAVGDVRGLGLMLGVELIDPATGAASSERARAARDECFARGLLCELGGRSDATLRLLPPLCLSESQAREALDVLEAALRVADARSSDA